MRRDSPRRAARTLAKYDTRSTVVDVAADLQLSIVETRDAYELLDRLIEREAAGRGQPTRFPYWAEVWPAALGLSRWCAGPGGAQLPAGPVLELGCGLGLAGITLARLGHTVEATDHVDDALVFAAHNARCNGVAARHRVSYLDWNHPVGAPHPLVIGSDVAYEKGLHPALRRTLRAVLAPGGQAIFSDPSRPAAQALFTALEEEEGFAHRCACVEVGWQALQHTIDIHVFERPA